VRRAAGGAVSHLTQRKGPYQQQLCLSSTASPAYHRAWSCQVVSRCYSVSGSALVLECAAACCTITTHRCLAVMLYCRWASPCWRQPLLEVMVGLCWSWRGT
jgi:hypothetical protein